MQDSSIQNHCSFKYTDWICADDVILGQGQGLQFLAMKNPPYFFSGWVVPWEAWCYQEVKIFSLMAQGRPLCGDIIWNVWCTSNLVTEYLNFTSTSLNMELLSLWSNESYPDFLSRHKGQGFFVPGITCSLPFGYGDLVSNSSFITWTSSLSFKFYNWNNR